MATVQTHVAGYQPQIQQQMHPLTMFDMMSRRMEAMMDNFFNNDPFMAGPGMLGQMRNLGLPGSNGTQMLRSSEPQQYGTNQTGTVMNQSVGYSPHTVVSRGNTLPHELARFSSFDDILRGFDQVNFPEFGSNQLANMQDEMGSGFMSQVYVARQKRGADGKLHTEKYFNTSMNGTTTDGNKIGQQEELYHNTEQNLKRMAQQRTLNDQGFKVVKSRVGDQPEEVHTIQHGFEDSGRADFERRWQEGSRKLDFSRALPTSTNSRPLNQLPANNQQTLPYTSTTSSPSTYALPPSSTTYALPPSTVNYTSLAPMASSYPMPHSNATTYSIPAAMTYTQPQISSTAMAWNIPASTTTANTEAPIIIRPERFRTEHAI